MPFWQAAALIKGDGFQIAIVADMQIASDLSFCGCLRRCDDSALSL
jgi:hypothetical protein